MRSIDCQSFRIFEESLFARHRGHVPAAVVQTVADIIEFCHLMFGAPNGLCSSITESKHIKAVKKPYRRTNHNKPLSQILLTNQRLDKLAAAHIDFATCGMLDGALLPPPPPLRDGSASPAPENPDDVHVDNGAIEGATCIGEVKLAKTYVHRVPRDVHELALYMEQLRLHELIR
ncbi:hypothetical protein DFH07DRAFT_772221 [Mycena maculata]|uniref:Uncharacterized protein n=1 Tax=Mycena maculata TaxID=230809 RepID=A0AAD7JCF3_9AGAR|nr:hypothetical protein DFH07DRAFT_772221 [Mycena maculata]